MPAEAVRDAASGQGPRTLVGTVNVVDPHPLNWLYITWNTMEEPVRTEEKGNIVGAAMEDSSLSIFLCCPMTLVAANRHVKFTGDAATLELAETEVTGEHWSRR